MRFDVHRCPRPASFASSLVLALTILVVPRPTAGQEVPGWLDEPIDLETPDGDTLAARAGWLEVPVRHEAPEGPTWRLRVLLLPARGEATEPPVVYLAGGPGDSGTAAVDNEDLWDQFAAIRASANVYLLDQRGAGRSEPDTRCDPSVPMTPEIFASHADMLRREVRILGDCAREVSARGIDLSALDAHQSALDLRTLRDAIGAPRVSLLGFSYGTHLALTIMRRIPDVLHRVVLVGVEGPDHTFKLPSTLDGQIFRLGALAAADPVVGEDVPDLSDLLSRTLARLDAEPVPVIVDGRDGVEVTVPVSGDVLRLLLRLDMGDGYDFPAIPAMLAELERGDVRLLRSFLGRRYRGFSGRIRIMPDLVDCASGATSARLQRILVERPESFIADATDLLHPEACRAFEDPEPRPGHRSPLLSRIPTLLVSGTLDSNTPPFQAEEVRWGLPAAEHVVVEHASHQDHFDDPRVRELVATFLKGGQGESRFLPSPRPRFVPVWPPTHAPEPAGWSEPLALEVVERDGDLQPARYDPAAGTFTMEGWGLEGRVVERIGYGGALFLRIQFEQYDLDLRARLDRSDAGVAGVWWIDNRPEGTLRSLVLTSPSLSGQSTADLQSQVEAAERAFARTMADRDLEAFAALVAEDAVFFGSEPLQGREEVVEGWAVYFQGPEAPFSWEPEEVVVLASGALAHSSGPVRNPAGEQVGTFNSVWRLEADGRWRVIFDKGCGCPNLSGQAPGAGG